MWTGVPLAPRRKGDEGRRAARLSVGETDRKHLARLNEIGRQAGGRRVDAAIPIRSPFALRLEHELQTVVGRQRQARPLFSLLLTVPAGGSHSPLGLSVRAAR